MRRIATYPFGILSLFSVACAGPAAEPAAGASADLASLATSQFEASCSAPVRSSDGAYVALDLCPLGTEPGSLVRVTLATGERQTIATYPATDRLESLGAKGAHVYFAVRHQVDGSGLAAKGIDVQVHDWALGAARIVPAAEGATTARSLATLLLAEDGSAIAFAPGEDANESVFVAKVDGTAAATPFAVGPTAGLAWATSKGSFALVAPDAEAWAGETVTTLAPGADGAFARTQTHVAVVTAAFGQGGTREQAPLQDGMLLGLKGSAATGATALARVDLGSGAETTIDTGGVITVVTDLGADVLYTKLVSAEGSFTRTLVKAPRAGGDKTVLLTASSANEADVSFAFEAIALDPTGAFGLFGTQTAGKAERSLVKLDGSVAPVVLAAKTFLGDVVGTKVFAVDANTAGTRLATVIDLASGATVTLGAAGTGATAYLAGDGTAVELSTCTLEAGGTGTGVRRLSAATSAAPPAVDCAYRPWASLPLAVPGSGALVFFGSKGAFPSYRFDIGVLAP